MGLASSKVVEKNKYELEITVGSQDFVSAVERSFHKNASKLNVPGFRKGKAPRTLIEKTYGKDIFYEDAINELYPKAYEAAIDEAGIEPVDRAEVEIISADENGLVFKAFVTVAPEVTLGEYKGLTAEKTIFIASEKAAEEELENLRQRGARSVPVEREAQSGDIAIIDFEGYVDGKPFPGGGGTNEPVTLGTGRFIPGFEDQILGHRVGDEFDITVTFPEDYRDDLKGKEAKFKIKLLSLSVLELPQLDDEFAKDVSEFETLDELRADIKKNIQENGDRIEQSKVDDRLIDLVIQGMTCDVPRVMIERKIDELLFDFDMRLRQQDRTLDVYLDYIGVSYEDFRKSFEENAARQVNIGLALEKIVKLENIEATPEEIESEYKKIAEQYKKEIKEIKEAIPQKQVEFDLKMSKAVAVIKDTAIIKEKTPDEEAVVF